MKREESTIAKITRPRLSGIFRRERLFHVMDHGARQPATWVVAPAGSGKTTLVASWLDSKKLPCLWYQVDAGDGDIASFFYYMGMAAKSAAPRYKQPLPLLTPEYLQGISVFTRRYFEELFRRLKRPSAVILDNYQDAPQDSGFHEMISHALETVPEGMRVIILSRNDPPPQLARLQANNRLQLIGWEDIRFTLEESRSLLKAQGRGPTAEEIVSALHTRTEGWAAGLVLLTASTTSSVIEQLNNGVLSTRAAFDYFASEIFDRTPPVTQHVLLTTAFLPRVIVPLAQELTGVSETGRILEELSKRHYFTQQYAYTEQAYQYHPLFQEFLLARAETYFDPAERLALKRKAALLLQSSGRNEDAASLLALAGDWQALARLVLLDAPALAGQGRHQTLEQWIRAIPDAIRNDNAWMLYWLGVCRLPFDPVESRGFLERAFEKFELQRERAGAFMAWSLIIQTFGYEWGYFRPLDRWIAAVERLLALNEGFPSKEIEDGVAVGMFSALTWRNPRHPDLPRWTRKVTDIVLAGRDIRLRMTLGANLLIHHLLSGERSQVTILLDTLRPLLSSAAGDTLTQQSWFGVEAVYGWMMNDHRRCIDAVEAGLRVADDTGVHLMDNFLLGIGTESCMNYGFLDTADNYIRDLAARGSTRLVYKSHFAYLSGWNAALKGDFDRAIEYGEDAVRFAEKSGYWPAEAGCALGLAISLFEKDDRAGAYKYLKKAREAGGGQQHVEFVCLVQEARFELEGGSQARGLEALRNAMEAGARQGFVNFLCWSSPVMSLLCAKALEHGIEPDYARKLIKERKLEPPEQALDSGCWPYPVRVYTLGRFEVIKHGKVLKFSAKKKLVEMFKCFLAFGRESVREEQVSGLLWPDSEGDAAHIAFKTTLSRLRTLIGAEAILFEEGAFSLNRKVVWTDLWAFEQLSEEAERRWKFDAPDGEERKESIAQAISLTGKALALYGGSFLPADTMQVWTISRRERLRDRLLRLTLKLGRYEEEKGKWLTAADHYRRALEADRLQEEFYQRLIICLDKIGQRAAAVAVYERCRAELSTSLGVVPSEQTMSLYSSLLQ